MQNYFSTIIYPRLSSEMATSTRISFHDKLDFEARNHFLTRSRSAQTVGLATSRGVIFQPRYHQTSFARPNFVFHCKKARAGCREVSRRISEMNRPALAYDNNGVAEEPKHKLSLYFPVLGTRDGLTEKARYYLSTSKTPYTNPKPHDFRPVSPLVVDAVMYPYHHFCLFCKLDDGPYTLRTVKTPDPTNLKLQIEGLSVINCDKGEFMYTFRSKHSLIENDFFPRE